MAAVALKQKKVKSAHKLLPNALLIVILFQLIYSLTQLLLLVFLSAAIVVERVAIHACLPKQNLN